MPTPTFRALLEDIAVLVGHPDGGRLRDHVQLDVDGTAFTVMDSDAIEAGSAAYFCDFGALPRNSDRALALERLLECNLVMFGPGLPVFSINGETDHALLMGRVALNDIEAENLLSAFTRYAAQARQWRATFFLDAPQARGPARGRRLQAAVKADASHTN